MRCLHLARSAAERFGLEGVAVPLPGELDRNFAIGGHVLKLHAAGTDPGWLDLLDAAMEHVAARSPGVATPHLVRALDGSRRVAVDGGFARVLTWVPGTPWGRLPAPPGAEALRHLGRAVAGLDAALADFDHPRLDRRLRWNMLGAADLRGAAPAATPVLESFAAEVLPDLRELPAQAIHNDANEHNILVGQDGLVSGLIDFGDVCRAPRVCGLAVACAYAMTGLDVPEREILPLVAGYHAVAPLDPHELALLPALIRTRLAMSVAMAALQHAEQPDNAYVLISQRGVTALLQRLGVAASELERLRLRAACGYEPVPHARAVRAYLATADAGPVCGSPLDDAPAIDFSGHGPPPGGGPALGRYLEDRRLYTSAAFEAELAGERRTLHLGVDIVLPPGEPILAPLDGIVRDAKFRPAAQDWGGVVVLDHLTPDGTRFHTLYGHLDRASTERLPVGRALARGATIGHLGDERENGGWAPHLHLQLLTTDLGRGADAHGVGTLAERDVWESVSPDPNLLLGLPHGLRADPPRAPTDLRAARRASLSRALSLAYGEPLEIVRGAGARLYDERGRAYVDLVNNVAHVGHAHPRVVAAAAEQMARLNTNTRYLHELLVTYAKRLTATLPDPLSVVFLVNSGSEANDLALRLARTHTGSRDVLVLDHAYHGNLSSLIDISPYKFDGPGGAGRPEHVRVARLPRRAEDAEDVGRLARPGAFIVESLPGVAGQIVLPDGYLGSAHAHARASGAVCIADEVQVGFGRVGRTFWGFELQGVVPDIVTLGKPIGNGHPIGAVVTTPAIARSFETGMEYFNTFGGNPVSCAAALAVLDVIADERLQAHAARLGRNLKQRLEALTAPQITDVRGEGLFLGVELTDADHATAAVEHARRQGVLLSTDGPRRNVIKLKPPLVITEADADRCVKTLDAALAQRP